MAITANPDDTMERIYTRRTLPSLDPAEMRQQLIHLMERGQLTSRDERLLEYLRELHVLSLDQIRRLLWNDDVRPQTVYDRLRKLTNRYLLDNPRTPRAEMRTWGLTPSKTYALGSLGRLWLEGEPGLSSTAHYLKRNQVLHDLLVAELCVRMTETTLKRGRSWSFSWAGERSASFFPRPGDPPVIAPDGLGILTQHEGESRATLPFFIEVDASRQGHGRLSSDWGRKLIGYDRFAGGSWRTHPELGNLPDFPVILVVTHGAERLHNLARAIAEKRQGAIYYYLALWSDLAESDDIFSTPAWLVVTPDGQFVGWEPVERRPLIVVG